MPEVSGTKLVNLADLKVVHDLKLDKDISALTALPGTPDQTDVMLIRSSSTNYKVPISKLSPSPLVLSIPAGQWSGSSGDYYITVSASRVTENSILVPNYDSDSAAYLKGPVWCVPDDGTFTIHTSDVPTDAVTIMVQFPGTMGEAQYQVLADVYSTSQTYSKEEADAAIAQSTANSISYQSGDSISSGNDWIVLPGVINDNSKTVEFTLPLTKTPVTDRTYTLTYLKGRILKPDGGMYESTKDYLNYTGCTTTIVENSGKSLVVRLAFDTALTIAASSFIAFYGRFDITVS